MKNFIFFVIGWSVGILLGVLHNQLKGSDLWDGVSLRSKRK